MDNLLLKCGFVLKNGKEPNQLNQDQAVFQKKMSDHLQRACDNPQMVDQLTDNLLNYIEDKNKFFFALQNTTVVDSGNSRKQNQDSLFHLLLGINLLRKAIINLLFEKLAELSGMDESVKWKGDNFSLTHLIVKQFRCVDKLENSDELCEKVLEILEVVDVETQQNIIGCLPEIFPDYCHPTIAKSLCAFLNSYSPVTVYVLDALSSLNVSMELLTEIENSAALATAWMKVEHLPVVIRFLFNTCGERNTEVISTLRTNIASTVFTKNVQQANRMSAEERNQVVVILDQFKFFIQTKKSVAEAWIQVINENVDPQNEVIDLFVILILHSVPSKESSADTLLRNQIKLNLFGDKSLTMIFSTYHWAMKDYFDVTMKVATKFSKYDKEMFLKFGTNLYKYSYEHFDLGFKQAVIENLLDHFASYKSSEIDCAIDLLTELTENNPEQMASFAVYIKRLIDYFDRLALHQIRSIYSCLSILACKGGREGELLQNDLQTIVQKQLTNSDLKYKRIGIVGSLMLVKHLASSKDTPNNNQHSKRALNLLELLHASVQNEKSALALFYDVASSLVQKRELNKQIDDWINDNVSNCFLDNYILDLANCDPQYLQFGLDADNVEDGIVVNLYPLIESEENDKGKNKSKKASPLTLTPQFRLLQFYEKTHNDGDIEGIDALLSCSIFLYEKEKLEEFATLDLTEKNLICSALFYTLNWFREVLNAFTIQTDPELRPKVVARLKNITQLETTLKKCLASNPSFRPPLAHFDADEKVVTVSLKRKKEATEKKPLKKRKNSDVSIDETQLSAVSSTSDSTNTTKKISARKSKEKEATPVVLAQFAQYFRELDFDVFDLLKEKMSLPNSTIVSQMDKVLITPLELIFLLEDLKAKLEFRLLPSTENLPFGPKGSTKESSLFVNLSSMKLFDVVKKSVSLIPHLCLHLESASEYFQTINAEVMDSDEARSEPALMMASCLKLILESLSLVFSWKEFDQHRPLQRVALRLLADRMSSSGGSQLNVEDCANRALDYVMKFSESVPNFSCAVAILSLGEKLFALNKTDANLNRLSKTAEEFLKRPWFDKDGESEQGTKHNQELQKVLTLALELNSDPLQLLQTLATDALAQLVETQVESQIYRTMTTTSFSLYYRVMFANLVKEAKKIANDKPEDVVILLRWNIAVKIFHILVKTIKVFGNQTNYISCAKYSRTFIDTFLKLGMPLMDSALRNHKDDVLELLRTFQLGTRGLQNLCCHAKTLNQVAIIKHIPHLKKNLEAFIYRVKAMLALHSCQEAFWVGNLKNKDIQGEEIHMDVEGEVDENEEDEEDGDDDDDVPEELQTDEEDGDNDDGGEIVDDEENSYSQSY